MADDTGTILELYKTAVEMADRLSARRAGTNTFFLTLSTALAAVVGIVSSARKPPPHGDVPSFDSFGLGVTAVAGIIFALVWWLLIRYYRRLSTAKWDVINVLETRLPASPFTDEWRNLYPDEPLPIGDERPIPTRRRNRLAGWWRHTKHREATAVEQVVPIVFVVVYVVLLIRVAVQ
ncbi:MAG TPA: hypothetical protein VG244_06530 [Acidimicrobiales bacterium]|jgi:hypothetical protein|nr:hypothetical protein [Acidimicrobiales bacterium]